MRRRRFALSAVALLLLACSACGSGSTPAPSPPGSDGPFAAVTGSPGKRPHLKVPHEAPPSSLQVEDLSSGSGAPVASGDVLVVQYQGVAWSTGKKFDASWDIHQPYTFPIGQGMVISGWDQGLLGMRVGGRRELVIPPSMAYGADGRPPKIGPNETLVFVVDLLSVQSSQGS
jgi:peptidylprolyl isomerase